MSNLVLLKTYHNKYEAEATIGLLKGNGIEAILSSDISLGDNQILVKKEDLEKAREAIKLLEESLSEGQIREAAIGAKETPAGKKKSAKDFLIVIPLIIAAIFLCSSVFQGIHKPRYYKKRYSGEGLDCKQPSLDSIYTVCKEYYKSRKVRTIVIFKKNKVDGPIKEFFENGVLRREWMYANGKLDGPFKGYYPKGQVRTEGVYKNHKMEGEHREYYETGELKRIMNFKNDLFDGHYKTFYESGKLAEDIELKNGVRFDATGKLYQGIKKMFYENGILWELFNYKDGMLEGLNKSYYENGNLEWVENYHKGKSHGEAKDYYPNGNLQSVFQSKEGVPIAVKEYDQEGNVIFESVYE